MSRGSRATRRNLKRRHPIPSEEIDRVFLAGHRRCVCMCTEIFQVENLFECAGASAALLRDTVLKQKLALEN
jgi:hypothetical protein